MMKNNSMKGAVVVFAKTVGLSPVKTRLAKDIGQQLAEEFYQLSLSAVLETCNSVAGKSGYSIEIIKAVAESDSLMQKHPDVDRLIYQGPGELGEKISCVYKQIVSNNDFLLFIGGDSPQINSEVLLDAVDHLTEKSLFLIGPAEDGGFWMWGGSKKIKPEIWQEIPYSDVHTCEYLEQQLSKYGTCRRLTSYSDVDYASDLISLKKIFQNKIILSTSQKRLLNWLNQNEF